MTKTRACLLLFLCFGCANQQGSETPPPLTSDEEAEAAIPERPNKKRDPVRDALADADDGDFYVSNDLETLLYSLGNNPLSGLAVPKDKIKEISQKLEVLLKNPKLQNPHRATAQLSLARLNGANVAQLIELARKVHNQELLVDAKAALSEIVHLDLASAAIKERRFALAEYHLDRAMASGDPVFRAAVLNMRGYLAYRDGDSMAAMAHWREALVSDPGYIPARLNTALVALEFGDARTASANLTGLPLAPVTQLARLVALRQSEKPSQVANLCGTLPSQVEYSPLAFSCALNLYEGLGQIKAGKAALTKLSQIPKLPGPIEQRAYKTLERIATDERLTAQAPKSKNKTKGKKTGKKGLKRGKN